MNDLDDALIAAHAIEDKATLVILYAQAAAQTQDIDTKAFFLTHAYIFALEINHPNRDELRSQLAGMGRETE